MGFLGIVGLGDFDVNGNPNNTMDFRGLYKGCRDVKLAGSHGMSSGKQSVRKLPNNIKHNLSE